MYSPTSTARRTSANVIFRAGLASRVPPPAPSAVLMNPAFDKSVSIRRITTGFVLTLPAM